MVCNCLSCLYSSTHSFNLLVYNSELVCVCQFLVVSQYKILFVSWPIQAMMKVNVVCESQLQSTCTLVLLSVQVAGWQGDQPCPVVHGACQYHCHCVIYLTFKVLVLDQLWIMCWVFQRVLTYSYLRTLRYMCTHGKKWCVAVEWKWWWLIMRCRQLLSVSLREYQVNITKRRMFK